MSESSPLLMNLGTEVATASGVKPIADQTAATGGDGGFASVLQSVLPVKSQQSDNKPLITGQLATNPLLLSQLDDSVIQLLKQGDVDLAGMFSGNSLPTDEQELAWQSLLAEYDSTDPDTPHLVVAVGDEDSYQIEEMTADDLNPVNSLNNAGKLQTGDLLELNQSIEEDDLNKPGDPDKSGKENSPELSAAMASANSQNTAALARSSAVMGEDESKLALTKLQQAGIQQDSKHQTSKADTNRLELQLDNNRFSIDRLEQPTGHGKSDLAEMTTLNAGLAANPATDSSSINTANTPANGSAAMLGASAYSAVSGLGHTHSTMQVNGQVITSLTVPPQNPAWGDIVGDRVQWMATQNIQEAKIRLNPPDLGLLEVRVQVSHDHHTSISFSSPHTQVRDALETAVPRLREMFGESGLTLGDVNISHQSMSGQGQAERDNNNATASRKKHTNSIREISDVALHQQPMLNGTGMLDLYA